MTRSFSAHCNTATVLHCEPDEVLASQYLLLTDHRPYLRLRVCRAAVFESPDRLRCLLDYLGLPILRHEDACAEYAALSGMRGRDRHGRGHRSLNRVSKENLRRLAAQL